MWKSFFYRVTARGRPASFLDVVAERLPKLTWLVDVGRSGARLYRGPWVESRADWFAEGAWAGDFSNTGLLNSVFRCCSGGVLTDDGLVFTPPSHSLEAIYCFRYSSDPRWLVSNSFACILGAEPSARMGQSDFRRVIDRAATIMSGSEAYERLLYQTSNGAMYRMAFSPFRIGLSLSSPFELEGARLKSRFRDFAGYFDRLVSTARSVGQNAAAPARHHPFSRLVSSISAGYDSPTTTAIAKTLGTVETVTLTTGRGGTDDSGHGLAEMMGLQCHPYPRFASGLEQMGERRDFFLNPGDCDLTTLPEVDAFLASLVTVEDAVFAPFVPHLPASLYFTGFHGDKIWSMKPPAERVIERGDNSGSGLDEVRKRLGFVHVPLAFVDATRSRRVGKISNSREMAPFSVGGAYDRPIPRRIVESTGVPRDAFGRRKSMGSVLLRLSPERRYEFNMALADRYAGSLPL